VALLICIDLMFAILYSGDQVRVDRVQEGRVCNWLSVATPLDLEVLRMVADSLVETAEASPRFLNLDPSPVAPDPARVELDELIRLFHGWVAAEQKAATPDEGNVGSQLMKALAAAGKFRVQVSGQLDAYFLQHLRSGYFPRSKKLQGMGKHPDEVDRKDVRKSRDGLEFDPRYMTVFFGGLVLRGNTRVSNQAPAVELWDDFVDETARLMRTLASIQRRAASADDVEPSPVTVDLVELVDLAAQAQGELTVRVRTFVESRAVPTSTVLLNALNRVAGSSKSPSQDAPNVPDTLTRLLGALESLATQYERGETGPSVLSTSLGSTTKTDYRALSSHLARAEAFMGVVEQVRRVAPREAYV
jgi:hypothetical protein